MKIDKLCLAARHAMDEDNKHSRYDLNHVKIHEDGTASATNGRTAIYVQGVPQNKAKKPVILKEDKIKKYMDRFSKRNAAAVIKDPDELEEGKLPAPSHISDGITNEGTKAVVNVRNLLTALKAIDEAQDIDADYLYADAVEISIPENTWEPIRLRAKVGSGKTERRMVVLLSGVRCGRDDFALSDWEKELVNE